jgi:hypothetical protein
MITAINFEKKFFLVMLGFELRALHFLGSQSASSAMPLAHFALIILEIGSHIYPGRLGLKAGTTGIRHYAQLLVEMGVS